MILSPLPRRLIIAGFIASLAACSSSDSDNVEAETADNAGVQPDQSIPVTPVDMSDEPLVDDNIQPPENTVDDQAGEPGDDTGNESPENIDEEPAEEETAGLLIPPLTAGSDLDRLVQGLTRQAASTLLDLNRLISQGEMLSAQQAQCLGSYEEGFGEPLMAVNCEQPLATGDVALWVGEAAFYNTELCRAALFNQGSDGCVLQRMTLTIRTDWPPGETNGNGRPTPAFPGALLAYAIDNTSLVMQNDDNALSGPFQCTVNLETATLASASAAVDCSDRVASIADEIERLQEYSTSD